MAKTKNIYRYYYNNTGTVEYVLETKANSRVQMNIDMPYVESDVKYNINEKKYDAANDRWLVNQSPAPTRASVGR